MATAYKGFGRLEKSDKIRHRSLKERTEALRNAREDKQHLAKERLKNIKIEHKDHFDHLIER